MARREPAKPATKTRRAAGDGGVHIRADGLAVATFYVIDNDGNRRQIRRAAKTKAEAIAKMQQARIDHATGTLDRHQPRNRHTLETWLTKWLHDIARDQLAPNTHTNYTGITRKHIVPTIGTTPLADLKPEHIRKAIKKTQQTSTRSAQVVHVILRRALDDAVNEELIAKNVARLVPKPKHVKAQRGAYDANMVHLILKTAADRDDKRNGGPYLAVRWAAAFLTGARQGELLGLTWDRVNLKDGTLDISWQLQNLKKTHGCGKPQDNTYPCGKVRAAYCPQAHFDLPAGFEWRECYKSTVWARPKTSTSNRIIPITQGLTELLKVHRRSQTDTPNPLNLVWTHDDGRPITRYEDMREWNALIKKCGIDKQPGQLVIHEARNTAATQLMEAGVDAKIIQAILGHSSVVMTREYQRVSLDVSKKAVTELTKLIPQRPTT